MRLNSNLGLNIRDLRLLCVYDLFGFTPELVEKSSYKVFGEPATDNVSKEVDFEGRPYLAIESLPGQFDQRAAAAVECVKGSSNRMPTSRSAAHASSFSMPL